MMVCLDEIILDAPEQRLVHNWIVLQPLELLKTTTRLSKSHKLEILASKYLPTYRLYANLYISFINAP